MNTTLPMTTQNHGKNLCHDQLYKNIVIYYLSVEFSKKPFLDTNMLIFFSSYRSTKSANSDSSNLAVPKLSVCADAQKVDRNKLLQTEFSIIEFDADTFQVLLDYLHSGCCPLSCISIPGFIQFFA